MASKQISTKRLVFSSTAIVLLVIILLGIFCWMRNSTIVLVIRHAEKNTTETCLPNTVYGSANYPLLLVDGKSPRAQALVHACGDAGIAAIYTSEFCRTQQTAEPLAAHLGIIPNEVNQFAANGSVMVDDLIERIHRNNKGQVVLIVGHSNTIPPIIEGLSGITIPPLNESEFDNLYIVTIHRWFGRPKLIHLRYGDL